LPKGLKGTDNAKTGSLAGYGQALKLSSEFIGGIAVGVGIGWMIDRLAGTSPWGLIVFLLLGFCAGVLNVLRSAGLIAGSGYEVRGSDPDKE
jgi:ATP synthase protein I